MRSTNDKIPLGQNIVRPISNANELSPVMNERTRTERNVTGKPLHEIPRALKNGLAEVSFFLLS